MSKPIEKAFIIAWALGCCFYFMEYVVRSSPAVMIANLAARLKATPLVVSGILGAYYYTYSVTSLVAGSQTNEQNLAKVSADFRSNYQTIRLLLAGLTASAGDRTVK